MTSNSYFLNDGSAEAPKLRVYMNLGTLADLPDHSVWPGLEGIRCYRRLQADGFEGVELTTDASTVAGSPFPHCGLDSITAPADADKIAAKHAARGDFCLTVHAGWGIE